jgi:hypothetical protein
MEGPQEELPKFDSSEHRKEEIDDGVESCKDRN